MTADDRKTDKNTSEGKDLTMEDLKNAGYKRIEELQARVHRAGGRLRVQRRAPTNDGKEGYIYIVERPGQADWFVSGMLEDAAQNVVELEERYRGR
jgi:hypothetical protein